MKYQTKTDKRGRLIEIHVPLEKQEDMFCRFNYSRSVMDDGTEVCFARVSDDGCSAAICCGRTPKEALVEAIETDSKHNVFHGTDKEKLAIMAHGPLFHELQKGGKLTETLSQIQSVTGKANCTSISHIS